MYLNGYIFLIQLKKTFIYKEKTEMKNKFSFTINKKI